jgi:kinesin family protein C1
MGWSPADCLQHKISFAKRCDEKKKVETLAAHLKRLRAVGWHLYEERDQAEAKITGIEEELKAEKQSRVEDEKKHEEAAQLAQLEAEDLQQKLESAESEVTRRSAELQSVREELADTLTKLKNAEAAHEKVSGELATQEAAAAALQQRLQAAETTASDAQKYSSQLQEYNLKMQSDLAAASETSARLQEEKAALAEEAASLRGRVDALGDALSALQAANSSSETVRQAAAEEAARLRADLASACAERNSLSADVTRLRGETDEQRKELERFRTVTGKDVAALEAERASSAALVNRTEAQAATLAALQDQVSLLKEQRNAAEATSDSKTDAVRTLTARVAQLEALLSSAEQRIRDGEAIRRRLHNTILELKGNVRVFCRVRPPTTETEQAKLALSAPEDGELAGRGVEIAQAGAGGPSTKGPQRHVFTFDKVFGPRSGQSEVFEEVSALVQSALDGYRVTVFAYGQTNAGKTYTMLGRPGSETEGIIPRAVRQVFSTAAAAAEQGWKYEMRAAMLEIYNEELKDLLGKGPPAGKKHVISHETETSTTSISTAASKQSAGNGTSVSYLEWVDVNDEEKVSSLLQRAMNQRSVGATASNEQSSRSHMVFMLTIQGSNETTGQKMSGALNLVDLAGSERLSRSCASGERLKETQAINKSLSALGDVIAALGARESHVPYRNSKLTFLLQNSLSGAGKALMLCNVSPAVDDAPESLCTLRFAAKVNATEIGTARRNVVAATGSGNAGPGGNGDGSSAK